MQSAPVVRVSRGEAFIVSLRGLPERTRLLAQVRSGTRWVRLDELRTNGSGRASLPALDGKRTGEYVVRLRDADGGEYFIKIVVLRSD